MGLTPLAQQLLDRAEVVADDLVGGDVHVPDAEPALLEHPETGAVEQGGHEPRDALETLQQSSDLVPGEHHRQPRGPLGGHESSSHDMGG